MALMAPNPIRLFRVLLLEDDAAAQDAVQVVVHGLGWSLIKTDTIRAATLLVAEQKFDILIIDRGLKKFGRDGLDLIKELARLEIHPATLILSAMGSTRQRVEGLEAGADDYLVKPFEPEELEARLKALLRRRGLTNGYPTMMQIGPLEVRRAVRAASWEGNLLPLSDQSYQILELLAQANGSIVSREMLWSEVWQEFSGIPPQNNVIDVAVGRLRRVLRQVSGKNIIRSVHARGYSLAL
jgi:two-component system, OmpR family, response regulator